MFKITARRFACAALGASVALTATAADAQITFGTTTPAPRKHDPRDNPVQPEIDSRTGGGSLATDVDPAGLRAPRGLERSVRTTFAGIVTGVGNGAVRVQMAPPRVPAAMEQTFQTTPATAIFIDGRPARLSDLREGEAVRVTTYPRDPEAAIKIIAVHGAVVDALNPNLAALPDVELEPDMAIDSNAPEDALGRPNPALEPDVPGTADPRLTTNPAGDGVAEGVPAGAATTPTERPVTADPKALARNPADGARPIGPLPTRRPKLPPRDPQPTASATPDKPVRDEPAETDPTGLPNADVQIAAGLGLEVFDSPGDGVLVTNVTPDGPAALAGLLVGDFVMKLNDKPVADPAALDVAVADAAGGDRAVTLAVWRDGKTRRATVRPADHDRSGMTRAASLRTSLRGNRGGERIAPLNLAVRDHERSGVEVASVADSASGDDALKPGDVILSVNGQPIDTAADLRQDLELLPPGTETVNLVVRRDGKYLDATYSVKTAKE